MGFLADNSQTLTYEESKEYQQYIKEHGIIQFLNMFKKFESYQLKDMHLHMSPEEEYKEHVKKIYWGEEQEAHYVVFDHEKKTVKIVPGMKCIEKKMDKVWSKLKFDIHPEYGNWMVETVPRQAYKTIHSFKEVLECVRGRSKLIKEHALAENEYILQSPVFGMLGTEGYVCCFGSQENPEDQEQQNQNGVVENHLQLEQTGSNKKECCSSSETDDETLDEKKQKQTLINNITGSQFIDDRIINPHNRFGTLTKNIRTRRGEQINIQIPIFKDINTSFEVTPQDPYPGFIFMDAMAFGMGACCLQTTFSARDFKHARWLYDQLSVLSPMFLAASAGSCFFRGKLADVDTRWDTIAASVDCRTSEERDPKSQKYIPKSRYESISLYISEDERHLKEYDDYKFPLNEEIMKFTKEQAKQMKVDVDELLLRHLGFLYKRDAMVIFKDRIEQDDEKSSAHYENIQSTNWNSMRLKLPPEPESKIGWRVEFRAMELQLTDDENAAFSILVQMIVRMLYEDWFQMNLYIPMSMNEENFRRANKRDAILEQKFFFRTNIFDQGQPKIQEMTAHEIFFGAPQFDFKGLFAYKQEFVTSFEQITNETCFCCDAHCRKAIQYLNDKSSGKIKTLARWQREFLLSHPKYKQDSNVSQEMAYDLYLKMSKITLGEIQDPNFPQIFK